MKDLVRILHYVRPFRRLAMLSCAFVVVGTFSTLLTPWPLKLLFDSVLGGHPLPRAIANILGPVADDRVHLLVIIILASMAITILNSAFSVLDTYVNVRIEQSMILEMRSDIFRHAFQLPPSYYDTSRAGMIIYAINNEAAAAALIVSQIPPLMQSLMTLVGMIWITFRIEWHLALLSLIIVPLLYYAVTYYIKRIQPRLLAVKMLEGESLAIIHEAISMLRVIIAFVREHYELRRFRVQGEAAIRARITLTIRQTIFNLAVNTTTALGVALVLGFGAYYVLKQRLTPGDLLVIMAYVAAMYTPLETISTTIGSVQDQLVSLRVAFRIQDTEPDIKDLPDAAPLADCDGEVTFENVAFRYNGRESTLRDVSFSAAPGEAIAIVGPTGAGKTTLISLLPRFYDAQDGRILVDGRDIRTLTLASLREQISVVQQEALLFSGSIADNIRYGRLEATQDEIVAAAQAANAHDFVMGFPRQYETVLGERGAQLSGGERQRIAIARAFLKDAPILILDEPTSAIDAKTEAVILDALDRLMTGRTTFIVAHRLSTIRHADQILVLDHGQIVERGTHDSLIAGEGLYSELYNTQTRGATPPPARAALPDGGIEPTDAVATAPGAGAVVGKSELASEVDTLPAATRAVDTSVGSPAAASLVPRPKIVLLGMMSKIPVPGVIWQTLHYLIGFERLGYDVYYVEAHARTPSMLMERESDDSSARAAAFIDRILRPYDLGDRWAFHALHGDGRCYGMDEARLMHLYAAAAAIINLHGGTEPRPEHYATDRLVYLETDPVTLQLELHNNLQASIDFLAPHCAFFTFAENLGNADCRLPASDRYAFRPTRQPVVTDLWLPYRGGEGDTFTTIASWEQPWREVAFEGEVYHWSKHHEFLKVLDLPGRTRRSFELALSAYSEDDKRLLEAHGWQVRRALDFGLDLDAYRSYIATSRGEFTVAKDQNVRLRSGWFSDRSATYLAAGRPVIMQDTGFGNALPTGRGLFAFRGTDEIEAALDAIDAGYRAQCDAAAEIGAGVMSGSGTSSGTSL
jgi:ABC-type multidrug transport system fused ATPase/permease subunit